MCGPVSDAEQPPRGLAEPGHPALGTPRCRTEQEPWGTGALHSHHEFSLTGRGKRRGDLSSQILLPRNPLPQITRREHQGLCNTGKHTWPSNTGVQRLGWTLSGPASCCRHRGASWEQRASKQWLHSGTETFSGQEGGQPGAGSCSARLRCEGWVTDQSSRSNALQVYGAVQIMLHCYSKIPRSTRYGSLPAVFLGLSTLTPCFGARRSLPAWQRADKCSIHKNRLYSTEEMKE